MEICEQYLKL